jgi:hypothetical protein
MFCCRTAVYGAGMKITWTRSRVLAAAAALLAAVLLSGCAVTVTDGRSTVRGTLTGRINISIPTTPVITRFSPTRGEGAVYRVGEPISFNLRTSADGYVTLTYLDAGGAVSVFARNLYVRGGVNHVLSGPDSGHIFTVGFPRGTMLIRATFTPQPTNTGIVTYVGVRNQAGWSNRIELDVRGSPYADVVQTWLTVD